MLLSNVEFYGAYVCIIRYFGQSATDKQTNVFMVAGVLGYCRFWFTTKKFMGWNYIGPMVYLQYLSWKNIKFKTRICIINSTPYLQTDEFCGRGLHWLNTALPQTNSKYSTYAKMNFWRQKCLANLYFFNNLWLFQIHVYKIPNKVDPTHLIHAVQEVAAVYTVVPECLQENMHCICCTSGKWLLWFAKLKIIKNKN